MSTNDLRATLPCLPTVCRAACKYCCIKTGDSVNNEALPVPANDDNEVYINISIHICAGVFTPPTQCRCFINSRSHAYCMPIIMQPTCTVICDYPSQVRLYRTQEKNRVCCQHAHLTCWPARRVGFTCLKCLH